MRIIVPTLETVRIRQATCPLLGSFLRSFVCGGLRRASFPVPANTSGFPLGWWFPRWRFPLAQAFPIGGFPFRFEFPPPHLALVPELALAAAGLSHPERGRVK